MLRSARASSPSFGTGTEYSWTPLAGLSEEARSTSPSVICIKNFPVSSLLRSDHPKPSMTSDVSRKDCVAPLLYVLRGVRNGRALCAVVVDPELRVLRLQNRRNLVDRLQRLVPIEVEARRAAGLEVGPEMHQI